MAHKVHMKVELLTVEWYLLLSVCASTRLVAMLSNVTTLLRWSDVGGRLRVIHHATSINTLSLVYSLMSVSRVHEIKALLLLVSVSIKLGNLGNCWLKTHLAKLFGGAAADFDMS